MELVPADLEFAATVSCISVNMSVTGSSLQTEIETEFFMQLMSVYFIHPSWKNHYVFS